ncbi:MAG: hypothetical protein JO176_06590, partial [Acidimicrobiia bacterium]|nr:hypothetical protein [Acidimicrobiia bacterium]
MTRVARVRVVGAVLTALALLVMARPALAVKPKPPTTTPAQQQLQALKGQLNEVSADEAALLDQLDQSKA